ncbi:MAG: radical SAM protein [Thermodesulfobacteriota bacterium]
MGQIDYAPEDILEFTRYKYEQRLRVLEQKPGFCTWETTNRCNLRCKHCLLPDAGEPLAGELTTEEGYRLIDNLAEAGVESLLLSGGEPLARGDILDLVRYAARAIPVSINTNGYYLEEYAAGLKEVGLTSVQVSIDGATAESHDFLRGKGSYDRALRGLQKCRDVGLDKLFILSVVHHLNHAELPRLIDWAFDLGVSFFIVNTFVPVGRGMGIAHLALSKEERKAVYEFLVREQERGRRVAADDPCMYIVNKHVQAALFDPAHPLVSIGCGAGITGCTVRADGKVMPCPGLRLVAGDARTERLADLWRASPVFRALRDKRGLRGKCGRCEYMYICGGCRAAGLEGAGDMMGEDNLCWHEPRID